MKQPLIQCTGAGFGYEHIDAVSDVTMEILPGDYIGVVGENGAGKSTFIKGLLGLLKPTSGSISMAEELKRTGVGYLPQQTAAQKDFPATVWEVVLSGTLSRAGYRPFYSREEKELARMNMEKLGIEDLKKKCFRDLSGGQKQRVLIARALCATEKLLILDEPITGLDPSAAQEFYQVVRGLNRERGVAIVMVSHDVQNMVRQAKKILHLKQKVLFYGIVEEYRRSPLGRSFLGGEEE